MRKKLTVSLLPYRSFFPPTRSTQYSLPPSSRFCLRHSFPYLSSPPSLFCPGSSLPFLRPHSGTFSKCMARRRCRNRKPEERAPSHFGCPLSGDTCPTPASLSPLRPHRQALPPNAASTELWEEVGASIEEKKGKGTCQVPNALVRFSGWFPNTGKSIRSEASLFFSPR